MAVGSASAGGSGLQFGGASNDAVDELDDPTLLFKKTQANKAAHLAGLQSEADAEHSLGGVLSQQGAGIDQAQTAATQSVRRRAAQALAMQQGRLGTGGALAQGRQSAMDSGLAEGQQIAGFQQQRAQLALQQAAARRQSAEADVNVADERQKMVDAEMARGDTVNTKLAAAQQIFQNAVGATHINFSPADRQNAADAIQREFQNESDPKVKAAIADYIARVRVGGSAPDVKAKNHTEF